MKTSTRQTILLLLIACFIQNYSFAQMSRQNENSTNKMNVVMFSVFAKSAKIDKGFWTASVDGETACIQLMNSQNDDPHYIITNCFSKNEIKSTGLQDEIFEIARRAGTLTIDGGVLRNDSSGTFVFNRNVEFESSLKNLDIDVSDELYYFKLFLGDIQMNYITGIIDQGYEPTIREIGRLAYHDAGLDYIQQMSSAFATPPDLQMISKLAAHGVSVSYVERLKDLGYADLEPEMVKKLVAHKVSPEYIKSFQKLGFARLKLESIKKAKAHKLDPSFIVKARKRGNNFDDLHDYIRLKSRKGKI